MARILEQHTRNRLTIGECLIIGEYPVEALPYLESATYQQPRQWGHWNNLGICHKYLGDYEKAVICFDRALAISPDQPQIHHNYAMACEEMGKFDQALYHYARAACNSLNPDAQYGFAHCAFRERKFDLGLQMWEAARLAKGSALFVPNLEVWRGQDLAGKKILVIREGGYGDIFWLMRYLKPLKDLGAHVTFHVFKSQRTLLAGHPWIDRILDSDDDINEQEFDYQVPLWSVMWELRKAFPEKQWVPLGMDEPYIKGERATEYPPLSVGITWKAGELLSVHRKVRSIQNEHVAALAKVPVNWVSLVPGDKPDWCKAVVAGEGGWKATAEEIAGLDLVVSGDTATFHLSAAMGKPTIVFTPLNQDWKFLREGEKTSWYPNARIITNSDPVSFKPVVDRLVKEVTAWAEARRPGETLQLEEALCR